MPKHSPQVPPDIQNLRAEIDLIQKDFARLFQRRLQITEQIWRLKKKTEFPLFDAQRELEIIHGFDLQAKSEAEKLAMQNLFRSLLTENRKYLEATLP